MSMTQEEPGAFSSSVKETPAVKATGTNGAGGVYASSDSGTAISGQSVSDVAVSGITGTGYGVFGTSSSSGVGVRGFSTSGQAVLGLSTHGTAIYGSSENGVAGGFDGNVQVKGELSVTSSFQGAAVSAQADAGDGIFGHSKGASGVHGSSDTIVGVFGRSESGTGVGGDSMSGVGVFGTSSSGLAGQFDGDVQVNGNLSVASSVKETPAVKATGTNGAGGVYASSDTGFGVRADTEFGPAILGFCKSGPAAVQGICEIIAVYGVSSLGVGVRGDSDDSIGVFGTSSNNVGVKGTSDDSNGVGVRGDSGSGIGVLGSSDSNGIGVKGTSVSGLAGQFDGDVQVNGNLSVTGTKAFVQAHPTDPEREIVYVALEGGEAGTYVRGSGQLQSGKAVLALPEHFGLVTEPSGLTVQLTPRGEWLQLYVVELDTAQLVVREAQGKSGVFDYVIQGVRSGFEQHEVIRTKR